MICSKIQFALISNCDLVNPDNTLTQQGEHVKGCIRNGAALLLGFPPTAILSTLPIDMIAQLGGNFGAVNLSQLKDLGNLVV
jgi:hypothetical protein